VRIQIEAISCHSYSILLIANGVAREIDLSVSQTTTLAIEGDEYETPQETRTVEDNTMPKLEIISEPDYSEMK
jgi:hypothetical protein